MRLELSAIPSIATQPWFAFPSDDVPATFRRAAVLLLFFEEEGRMFVVATRRARTLRAHAGEVAFAGGRLEPGETPLEAALREAEEEIGIDPRTITVHGRLDDAWAGAGFHIVPIVASAIGRPALVARTSEVERVFASPLAELLAPDSYSEETVPYRGVACKNAVLRHGEDEFYGLSADLLLELVERIRTGATRRGERRLAELRAAVANGWFAAPR